VKIPAYLYGNTTTLLGGAASACVTDGNWIAVFQAGCHFWQHKATGECIINDQIGSPCPFHAPDIHCAWQVQEENEDEGLDDQQTTNIPYPESFRFLEKSSLSPEHNASGKE
jgi:hypothetical protein